MPSTSKRLGRGLSSLISLAGESTAANEGQAAPTPALARQRAPLLLKLTQIQPNPFQPRTEMSSEQLQSLANSIKKTGVIQPIVVRQKGELYELLAGERRWRASQLAGLAEIPAVVREASNEEMLEIALVENIFREDLNAIDRAMAYRRYCEEFDMTAEQVASRLGEDRSTVANYLRLLDLPSEVKQWVAEGKLAMGHARCLLAIRSPSDLVQTAKQAMDRDLSVRALEKLVRQRVVARSGASKAESSGGDRKRAQISSLEQAFVRALGTKVEIKESRRKGSGKITIHYFSLDDFDRISERIGIEAE